MTVGRQSLRHLCHKTLCRLQDRDLEVLQVRTVLFGRIPNQIIHCGHGLNTGVPAARHHEAE